MAETEQRVYILVLNDDQEVSGWAHATLDGARAHLLELRSDFLDSQVEEDEDPEDIASEVLFTDDQDVVSSNSGEWTANIMAGQNGLPYAFRILD